MGNSTVRAQPDPDGGTHRVISLQGTQRRVKPVTVLQDHSQANAEYYTNAFQLLVLCSNTKEAGAEITAF